MSSAKAFQSVATSDGGWTACRASATCCSCCGSWAGSLEPASVDCTLVTSCCACWQNGESAALAFAVEVAALLEDEEDADESLPEPPHPLSTTAAAAPARPARRMVLVAGMRRTLAARAARQ